MSNKQNIKSVLDHSVPSPKKNNSSNYYSQLLGRGNQHFNSGFMSPQLNQINSIHQPYQNPIMNCLQISSQSQSQLYLSQQQQHLTNSNLQNNTSNQNNTNSLENGKQSNNFKLTDILSTRYSSGTLKLMRNGQTSASSNPRQHSSDSGQYDIPINQITNYNQNKDQVHSQAVSSKNYGGQQNSHNLNQIHGSAVIQQNYHSNNLNGNTQQPQKTQLINKVKSQINTQTKQQLNNHHSHDIHNSQNNHNPHNSHNVNNNPNHSNTTPLNCNGNQQSLQSSIISPRTFSNLVQDKLIRSKLQGESKVSQQSVQSASASGSGSVKDGSIKDGSKNQQIQQKRPNSLKKSDNDHFQINQNSQMMHEQNTNTIQSMTLNNRNGSEKNLLKSQQFQTQPHLTQSMSQHQQQYSQHIQQLHNSKALLLQQQNPSVTTEQINNLMIASSKIVNQNNVGHNLISNQRYDTLSKHQTSHSLEKFRGQTESLDLHQLQRQQESLAQQVQKVIMNKQNFHSKKQNTLCETNTKTRTKKNQDCGQTGNSRSNFTKKQQSIIKQNTSNFHQTNPTLNTLTTSINNQSTYLNHIQSSINSNNIHSNYNNLENQSQNNVQKYNQNTKQTLNAITQRIQQNLNILNDPIQSAKNITSQNILDLQNFPESHTNYHPLQANIIELLHKGDSDHLQFDTVADKRDNSGKRTNQQNSQLISPFSSSKTHKQKNSISEQNKLIQNQQKMLSQETYNSTQKYMNQSQPLASQLLINQNLNTVNSGKGYHNNESGVSNTPQGKIVNLNQNKQGSFSQNKDGAKHQIYFMKEKDRGSKKYDYTGSKNKRKGEQSTPHSNSQGYSSNIMSHSAINNSSQGQFGSISALQKSQGSISTSTVNQINNHTNFLNSNLIKYLSKQLKNEEDKILEQTGINQGQNVQYLQLDEQIQLSKSNQSKELERISLEGQLDNIQTPNHHEKRNSMPEGSHFKRTFMNTESSYLGDLKQNELFPNVSPKCLTAYHTGHIIGGQLIKNHENMSCIPEVNSYQSAQTKNISNSSAQKITNSKHINPNQNISASPLISKTPQSQQFTNSFQQSKTMNDDSMTTSSMQDKGKYFSILFNNLFVKDAKKKIQDKTNNDNQTQENIVFNNSTTNLQQNQENANTSQNQEQNELKKQEQSIDQQYNSYDQKIFENNYENQQFNNNTKKSQIQGQENSRYDSESVDFTQKSSSPNKVQVYGDLNQSPLIHSQNNSINTSQFGKLKQYELINQDKDINSLREGIKKDLQTPQQRYSNNKTEFYSLNSSVVQAKNNQSPYVHSDNYLNDKCTNQILSPENKNYISQTQKIDTTSTNINFNPQLNNIQENTLRILEKYRNQNNQLQKAIQKVSIRISEQNQTLMIKDEQLNSLQAQNEELIKQNDLQNNQITEKDNFILFLTEQIQKLAQNSVGKKVHNYQNLQIQNNLQIHKQQYNRENNHKHNMQNNKIDYAKNTPQQYNSQNNNLNNNIQEHNQINIDNNFTSSALINRCSSNHNASFSANSPDEQLNCNIQQYSDLEEEQVKQSAVDKKQDIRHSLPVFSKKHFENSQEFVDQNQDTSSPQQEQLSADFSGNQDINPLDISLDELKKKYQVNSTNKRPQIKFTQSQKLSQSGTINNQQQPKSHNFQNIKINSQNLYQSNKGEDKDPLNDSTQLIKKMSLQSSQFQSQQLSDRLKNPLSSRKDSNSTDIIKPFQTNQQMQQQNMIHSTEENHNIFFLKNQGSFNNLQTLEKQEYEEEFDDNDKNSQKHRYSEVMTTTPSQNQTLQFQQRNQNRLFSADHDEYHSQRHSTHSHRNSINQINPNESFSNKGDPYFGHAGNSQNNDNSFGEQNFGGFSSQNCGDNKDSHFSPFDKIVNSQIQSESVSKEQNKLNYKFAVSDTSFRSKSSQQNKQNPSGNNSPLLNNNLNLNYSPNQNNSQNLNDSFSKISTPIENNPFQVNDILNESFNLNSQRNKQEEDIQIPFLNSSFTQIPITDNIDQNKKEEQIDKINNNLTHQEQINISFEVFGEQQIEQQTNSSRDVDAQQLQQSNENQNNNDEEQQQNISFSNQSFG